MQVDRSGTIRLVNDQPGSTDLARTPDQRHASGDGLGWIRKQARAHLMVTSAVQAGRLTRKPCEECGAEKVDAHHDDYDKPLDVRWLCRLHHRRAHTQGPRLPVFGAVSIRSFRDVVPDEICLVTKADGGGRVTLGVWIPIELVG